MMNSNFKTMVSVQEFLDGIDDYKIAWDPSGSDNNNLVRIGWNGAIDAMKTYIWLLALKDEEKNNGCKK